MSLPSNFPGEKSYRIVVGGDVNDYDPEKLSLMKTYDPTRHKFPEVSPEQLPFIGTERTATQTTLERFEAPPEQGSVVIVSQDRGFPTSAVVTGTVSGTEKHGSENVAGNSGLYALLSQVIQKTVRKRIKPRLAEEKENRVLVRKMKEKGQDWKHAHTKGIHTHAAFNQVFGQILKEVKNIETALQSFANIPSLGMLSQLPGQALNLASIFNKLTKQQKKRATQKMSPELVTGLENIFLLMGDASSDSNSYVASDRINPEIYTENMIELLSQCDNIGDLLDCIHRLNYDETLRGLEAYSKRSDSGLKANTVNQILGTPDSDGQTETSDLVLSDILNNARIHFDEGYSLNISNKTYLVTTANLSNNMISVYPRVEQTLESAVVYVYEPVLEFQTEGAYGPLTMTMDINGNVKPKKDSLQQLQQAMQAFTSIMNLAKSASQGQNLFGDAAGNMSQMLNRIPKQQRAATAKVIANDSKTKKLDTAAKNAEEGKYPFLSWQ